MTTWTITVEGLGLAVVGGASFFATRLINVKKFDHSFSADDTTNLLIAAPVAAYIAYRIYFGLAFLISSKIPYALIRTCHLRFYVHVC